MYNTNNKNGKTVKKRGGNSEINIKGIKNK